MSLNSIKRLIILLWASYFTVILTTNIGDILVKAGILSANWSYVSGNFDYIRKFMGIYPLPDIFVWVAYVAIMLLQVGIVFLFWKAFIHWRTIRSSSERLITSPFGMAILLWVIFIVSDEFFLAYDRIQGVEGAFFTGLIVQVITFILVLFVPREPVNVAEESLP